MNGWKHGTNLKYLKKISRYWVTKFNWRKQERKINKFSNYLTKVDGINIHFIKETGSGSNPIPLLMLHGWPGSVVVFLNIIETIKILEERKFTSTILPAKCPSLKTGIPNLIPDLLKPWINFE